MIRRFSPLALILVLAALSLAAPGAAHAQRTASAGAWRTDVPCTQGRNPALAVSDTSVGTQVPGCVRAECVTLPNGRRACSCTGDTIITVRLEENGRVVHEWPSDHSMSGSPQSLRALTGDLDGDGHAETIVAEWQDMSNGLGIRYYELRIFDGRDLARAPMRIAVRDFEPDGSFVRPAAGGDCRLIATRWQELSEPRRGEGMYFVGQWMRYRDGRLEHDPDRPVVVRRLLNSFENARGSTPGAPFAYLRHRDARAHAGHGIPAPPRLTRTEDGTFLRVRGDTVSLDLPPDVVSGHTLGDFYRDDDGWIFTTWLIDGATGRPYPAGYQPSDERWLDGHPVRLATHSDGQGRTVYFVVAHPPGAARP
ncbi:hypothetical protein [Longimicrobium sp.]|uniref:hypothetical protein n=1 Tax=Longimicrobium sp. TaxID=2029185 RepID=UPI002E3614CB|nr:hypothetical protein [Longimicrobium sp.]HEX6039572.1 hypothetical protein [Longimicrobium sp.]